MFITWSRVHMKIFRFFRSKLTKIFQLDRRWVRTMCGVMLVYIMSGVVWSQGVGSGHIMTHLLNPSFLFAFNGYKLFTVPNQSIHHGVLHVTVTWAYAPADSTGDTQFDPIKEWWMLPTQHLLSWPNTSSSPLLSSTWNISFNSDANPLKFHICTLFYVVNVFYVFI